MADLPTVKQAITNRFNNLTLTFTHIKQQIIMKRPVNVGKWLVLLLHFFISFRLIALDAIGGTVDVQSIYFETISTKNNLPNSVIYNIEQDSLGFLWLSSDDGLFRYDGQSFKVYNSTPNSSNSLTHNSYNDMHLDSSGNPWLLFPGALNKLDAKTEQIIHFYPEKSSTNALLNNAYQFTITPEDNLFITSRSGGLFFYYHNDSVIRNLFQSKQVFPAIASRLEAIAYKNNCLFVGKKNEGIYQVYLNEDNSRILNVSKIATTSHDEISIIFPDNNNNLWVGTSQGLIRINLNTGEVYNFETSIRNNKFLPASEVLSLFVDKRNNLWIGTRENGLSIVPISEIDLHAEQANCTRYTPSDDEGSLSNRCINKIFEDSNQNIWLGTYSGGIQFVSDYNKKIHALNYIPGHPESISHPKVWGITEDKNGNIWVGTDGGGIDVWHPKKGILKRLNQQNGLSDNAILCATTCQNGELWFGTYRGGINRINPENGHIKIYKRLPSASSGYFTNDIRIIYQGPTGKIWIGTNVNGLCRFDAQKD